jgi:catechol 2,3-dioxygenase-like lactoylglutathione lyase family enzyme
MAALDIHHVTINTADVDATVTFFNEIVGTRSVSRPDFGFPGAWLQLGATMFHLNGGEGAKGRDGKIHRGGGAVDHIALVAQGFDAVKHQLVAKKLAWRQNAIPSAGLWQLFVHDPNDVLIEFNFPIANEPKDAVGPDDSMRYVPGTF